MTDRDMTTLERLGAEKDEIDIQLKELRARRKAIQDYIAAQRRADLELSHDEIVVNRGHRVYVGGHTPEKWYGIGKKQYHYLVSQGLRPDHVFLDIACGSLRLGQYLIPYLAAGNYHGIDGSDRLIRAGLEHELLYDIAEIKAPRFAVNYGFDFAFVKRFDVALAQSLLTHLNRDDIALLFGNLAPVAHPESRFYFTFFEGSEDNNRHEISHPNLRWEYPFEALVEIAGPAGWRLDYIGDWGHSAAQMMVLARPDT